MGSGEEDKTYHQREEAIDGIGLSVNPAFKCTIFSLPFVNISFSSKK